MIKKKFKKKISLSDSELHDNSCGLKFTYTHIHNLCGPILIFLWAAAE